MKKSDLFTFEITAQEALRVYTIIGKTNGDVSLDFFRELKSIFDPTGNLYSTIVRKSPHMPSTDYHRIQHQLESLVFEGKSESQKQLDEVLKELEHVKNKLEALSEIIEIEKKF